NRRLMHVQTDVSNLAMLHHGHGPTSTYVALRRTSFVRPRNLRYCVRRPFHSDFPRRPPASVLRALVRGFNSFSAWPLRLAVDGVPTSDQTEAYRIGPSRQIGSRSSASTRKG